jgi:hypothetical protein
VPELTELNFFNLCQVVLNSTILEKLIVDNRTLYYANKFFVGDTDTISQLSDTKELVYYMALPYNKYEDDLYRHHKAKIEVVFDIRKKRKWI